MISYNIDRYRSGVPLWKSRFVTLNLFQGMFIIIIAHQVLKQVHH